MVNSDDDPVLSKQAGFHKTNHYHAGHGPWCLTSSLFQIEKIILIVLSNMFSSIGLWQAEKFA